ncbi:uncharacterized protein LOC122298928 [Carya illinoinensis]|uniref:uncharacterized protein LOC122298928 n=1 Tax=Carya illinoinensis TaxID=32201 RepID=UPI001C71AD3B|nr:uncharacterized protein LOC122298928 [Carya illinoinensis]
MNSNLQKEFVSSEVEAALKDIGPLKSPGPDGYGACFYQTYWSVVGNEIVSKVLANRLKKVPPEVISKNQSAFIPSRLITDNVMVAYETLHTMKTRQKGRIGSMALKLDISKAYDKIEWGFLEGVMRKLGFGEKWIKLVMDKSLSSLVDVAERNGEIKGVVVTRGGIRVNHLLFADDSIIYGRAKLTEWFKIQKLLGTYERASGQCFNRQKTTICFSSNTPMAVRRQIQKVAGVVVCGNFEKYLGLPSSVDRSRYNASKHLKERVWLKVNNWKNKFLSQAEKEVLLKAVVQAIPTYSMSVFMLPRKLCKEIAVIMARFWWSHMQNDKRIHWRSWSKMGNSKGRGGLGFRELECFNKAMLAKQVWRILNNPNSLVARVMQEKYFKGKSVLDARLGYSPSLVWKSLFSSVGLIKDGLLWRVGDGNTIKIWKDRWVLSSSFHLLQSYVKMLPTEATVKQLIKEDRGKWNEELINEIFNKEEAEAIGNIPLSKMGTKDKMRWGCPQNGLFSVKSAYHLEYSRIRAKNGESSTMNLDEVGWKSIWKLKNLEEFRIVNNPSRPGQVDRRLIRWKKLDAMVCKVNWDAALDAIVAEAYALRRAMFFCLELGLQKIMLEGDSQVVVKDTNGNVDIWADYDIIIEDTRRLMKDNMSWSVNFIHREANNVAHSLGKMALTCAKQIVWIKEGPSQIMSSVLREKYCND